MYINKLNHRGNYYNIMNNKVITNTTSNIIQLFINYHTEIEYNYKYLQLFRKYYFSDNYQYVVKGSSVNGRVICYLIVSSYCSDQTNNLLL
jgi:hypothetical protein